MVEGKEWALIAVVAVAPLAIVLIIALIRGYSIDVKFWRKKDPKDKPPTPPEE